MGFWCSPGVRSIPDLLNSTEHAREPRSAEFRETRNHLDWLQASVWPFRVDPTETSHSLWAVTAWTIHSLSGFLMHWFTAALGVAKRTGLSWCHFAIAFSKIEFAIRSCGRKIKSQTPLIILDLALKFNFFSQRTLTFLHSILYLIPAHHTHWCFPKGLLLPATLILQGYDWFFFWGGGRT